jgi:hypothetical protein
MWLAPGNSRPSSARTRASLADRSLAAAVMTAL